MASRRIGRIRIASVLLALSASVLTAASASAQIDLSPIRGVEPAQDPVSFRAELEPAEASPGALVRLHITATLEPDHHVYSLTQQPGGPVPTTIKLDPASRLTVEQAFQPDRAPEVSREPLVDVPVEEHHGSVTWTAVLRVPAEADPGPLPVRGTIRYMVCNSKVCWPPKTEAFEAVLQVRGDGRDEVTRGAARNHRRDKPDGSLGESNVFEHRAARFRVFAEPRTARPGDTITLSVEAEIKPPYHIYAITQPWSAEEPGPLPTSIDVAEYGDLEPLGGGFEGPQAIRNEILGIPAQYHEGKVTWRRRFRVPHDAPRGAVSIGGAIGYMICTDTACDPPAGFEFHGEVAVGANVDAEPASFTFTPITNPGKVIELVERVHSQVEKAAMPISVAEVPQADGGSKTGFALLLAGMAAGFLALLTPCVFPMIPITVSYFLKQAEKEHHKPALMALVYCSGIVFTFTVLGILVSVIFDPSKLNALANGAVLNLFIGVVLVFFALNMFGLFEIRLPAALARFTSKREGQGGYVGVLFMALTFTITSFTCTFAFVGGLLVLASQRRFVGPLIGLSGFSFAFALPFFFLALFPSLLARLPKGGGWMNSVKVVMGFVELALCLKFFSVADYIWNPTPVLFSYEFVLAAWAVIGVFAGLYLLGLYRLPHDMPLQHVGVARMVLSMSFLLLATYIGVGLFGTREPGGKLWEWIHAFAPPRVELQIAEVTSADAPGQPANGPAEVHGGLAYLLDFNRAAEEAAKTNAPMFLDFTGVNCINCRQMEHTVLRHPEIVGKLRSFVRAALYTDRVPGVANEVNERLVERNVKLQVDWFKDVTLPAYAIVTPDRQILAALKGQQSAEAFSAFLDQGIAEWQARRSDSAEPRVARERSSGWRAHIPDPAVAGTSMK